MNGADAFVRTLKEAGVDTFFGLPGSTEAPLLEAIRADGSIRYVLALHESAAVAMADGYARATGRVGVVGLHTTVGTMNGMSQVYNAARDGTPIVVTAGHKDRVVLAEDGFCAIPDLASLLRPFTKSSWQSLSTESIPSDLARAIHFAMTPPRGPAYLVIPEDLMEHALGASPKPSSPRVGLLSIAGLPDPADIRVAAEMLAGARHPVLVIGSHAAHATAEVSAVSEAFEVGVVAADLMDLAALTYPTGDPHYLGVYGEQAEVLDGCDLVMAVGCRVFFPFSDQGRPRLPAGAKLIHIHPDAAELGRLESTEVGLAGDPAAILRRLVAELEVVGGLGAAFRRDRSARTKALSAARREAVMRELEVARDVKPTSVARVAAEFGRHVPPQAIIVEEAVRASRLVFRHLALPPGAEVWRSTGGSLGWGLPAAVGAKLGRPDRPVVLLTGDGSFQFSVQALWTAVAQELPLVVVILDNGGYLAVKRAIEGHLNVPHDARTHPGTEISGIDHLAMARGYGAEGRSVSEPEEFAAVFAEAVASGKVFVISVRVAQHRP
jgi:benzoylformate decarboxylase